MTDRVFKAGRSRTQVSLLPPCLEDYVGPDNPARAIDAYVDGLNLSALGFRHAGGKGGAGQPAFDPAVLLKLYLYGYLNQVRSSRRLERETYRNLEVIWLLRDLKPGYRTIAKFRAENAEALRKANRNLLVLARKLDLLGGELVAIDGAFFHGAASKGSIVTRKRLAEQLAALERDIDAYDAALQANDAADETGTEKKDREKEKDEAGLTALQERRAAAQANLATLDASGQTQRSRTDPTARLLYKPGQAVAGYNVQIAVDAKHKLIVADEVTNDGNDSGQLHPMAQAAKAALGAETLQAVADSGYYNAEALKSCEDDAIEAYVPVAQRGPRAAADRFPADAFAYDAEADAYRCPAGALLRPTPENRRNASGKRQVRYCSNRATCRTCPMRQQCLGPKSDRREIQRWEHEEVLDRHKARMAQAAAAAMMQRRRELAEHPFGTLKCRAGYRHFLVRGIMKVRGEWSLMALCYNLTRMLTIVGVACLSAALARCIAAGAGFRATIDILCLCTLRAVDKVASAFQTPTERWQALTAE